MKFLVYINQFGKYVFKPLEKNGTTYSFTEINEPSIIAGVYENGKKLILNQEDLTPLEIYAMHNDIDLQMISENDFFPGGRKFDIEEENLIYEEIKVSNADDLGGGITEIFEDKTPKLGGDLEIEEKKLLFKRGQIGDYGNGSGLEYYVDDAKYHNFISASQTLMVLSKYTINVYKNIVPALQIIDLGISSNRFRNIYAKNIDVENGATGTFTTNDGKTVTVTKGIITDIV